MNRNSKLKSLDEILESSIQTIKYYWYAEMLNRYCFYLANGETHNEAADRVEDDYAAISITQGKYTKEILKAYRKGYRMFVADMVKMNAKRELKNEWRKNN